MRIALFVAGMLLAASLLTPVIVAHQAANSGIGASLTTGKRAQPILSDAPGPER